MRPLTVLFCLSLAVNAFSQSKDSTCVDSSNKFKLDSVVKANNSLIIIDGEISDEKKLKGMNPKDILDFSTLEGGDADGHTIKPSIIVATRQFEIHEYRNKLSAFSKDYEKYIEEEMKFNRNDDGIIYIVLKHGEPLLYSGDELIKELFAIPKKDIKNISFDKKQTCCGTNISVIITMK